jgi:hypothetical protein
MMLVIVLKLYNFLSESLVFQKELYLFIRLMTMHDNSGHIFVCESFLSSMHCISKLLLYFLRTSKFVKEFKEKKGLKFFVCETFSQD